MSLWRPLGWRAFQARRNALIHLRDVGACLLAMTCLAGFIWLRL